MKNKAFFATFAVGALFGAAMLLSMRGHDLDQLYLKVQECIDSTADLQEDKAQLQDQLQNAQKARTRRLRKFNVVVTAAPDDFTKLAVQKEVKNKLRFLMDKDLAIMESNPELFHNLLENRPITVSQNQRVTLLITSVIVGETTSLYLKAVKEDAPAARSELTP